MRDFTAVEDLAAVLTFSAVVVVTAVSIISQLALDNMVSWILILYLFVLPRWLTSLLQHRLPRWNFPVVPRKTLSCLKTTPFFYRHIFSIEVVGPRENSPRPFSS